jgi:hypothetical protein
MLRCHIIRDIIRKLTLKLAMTNLKHAVQLRKARELLLTGKELSLNIYLLSLLILSLLTT